MEQVKSFPDHLEVVQESCLSVFWGKYANYCGKCQGDLCWQTSASCDVIWLDLQPHASILIYPYGINAIGSSMLSLAQMKFPEDVWQRVPF